jgi:hypothetical protein
MSQEIYNIPPGPHDRYDYQRNLIEHCIANAIAWGIPAEKITAIEKPRSKYEYSFLVSNNISTTSPSATSERDTDWAVLHTLLIDLLNNHIVNNTLISAADKEALNIHYTSGNSGIASPAPITSPIVNLIAEEASVLHVVYADSATPSVHSKPDNVAFCELRYKIGDPPPDSVRECFEQSNIARTHEAVVFTPDQRGQKIYGYARWVNKNGKFGPWTSQISGLIP